MAKEFEPGFYIIQSLSFSNPFVTVEMSLGNDQYKPLVAVPSGRAFTVFKIEPLIHTQEVPPAGIMPPRYGQWAITWRGLPVIQAPNGKLIVYNGPFVGWGWDIFPKVAPSGEVGWLITFPERERYFWSVSNDRSPDNRDKHGHKYISLTDNPDPELTEMFYLTPRLRVPAGSPFAAKVAQEEEDDLPVKESPALKEITEGFAQQISVSSESD